MHTTVVIVTYRNRFDYLKQAVDSVLAQKVNRVIIVNNNSSEESYLKLVELEKAEKKINLITLMTNTGSSFAFKRGLEAAISFPETEFIWFLDDDNLPGEGALDVLTSEWKALEIEDKNCKLILASLRKGKDNYLRAIEQNNPESIIGKKNIFRSFHINNYFLFKNKKLKLKNSVYGEISAVPYGGMFFHKDLIFAIGYPDENFFLYCDDFDFCCRHRINGGTIMICPGSVINDIEISWNVQGRAFYNIATGNNHMRVYYSVRNRVYIEKKYLITSWAMYYLNLFVYSSIITIIALTQLKFKNLRTYYTAIYHGLTGKLGYNKNYKIE